MARVTVVLPKMVAEAHGRGRIEVEGETLRAALDALFRDAPALRYHLCEDSGDFRPHVLCIINETRTNDLDAPLKEGDRIVFFQAISGG